MQETIEKLYKGELYLAEQLEVHTKAYHEAKKVAYTINCKAKMPKKYYINMYN